MGETWQKIQQIANDIRVSRYFDIWLAFWAVCAIVGFACLIILAQQAQTDLTEKDVRVWIENATTINFPQFHIRFGGGENETIVSQMCWHMGSQMQIMSCVQEGVVQPGDTCFSVNSSYTVADQTIDGSERIQCFIESWITPGDTLMAFEFEGANVAAFGGNSYASIWFAPNSNAWIMLEKALYNQFDGPQLTEWRRSLLYHSTVSQLGHYNVTIIIGSFAVQHWDQVDSYTGWMSAGDIGGFAFFLVILHSIAMLVVGVFLNNNATFLGGKDDNGYGNLKS